MYTGTLTLDYASEEEEDHYAASVTRCILTDDSLALEFSGSYDGAKFRGSARLRKMIDEYHGLGNFAFEGEASTEAKIRVSAESIDERLYLAGHLARRRRVGPVRTGR
ncbi:MAG: hypothetical protein GKR94_35075 [Gammaproteobacteria bacterium]|nr:hypothetical protein [Gammaproteobacteria bacterium]NKC17232.1 hypothetical protein [Gammaproteobacteria bacterium]